MSRIQIDTATNTYRMANASFVGKNRYVTVELDGFRSVFNIEKHEVPSWNNDYSYDSEDGPDFYSYMITDKNRYKPHEKVRFKSYALSSGRTPLRKELEVWLLNYGKPKRVGFVRPQRPGSYASEFLLHDSLKLQLDRFYMLQLRERNSRVVASCNFKFEDYELFGNNLEIELKTEKQYHPTDNELTIKATDVNGLMLKDATANIIVTTGTIRETFDQVVILPDTVLHKKILLDPNTPTAVTIPSALFGKANVTYNVDVIVTNSENQRVVQSLGAVHYFSEYEIVSRFSNDSILYELQSSGVTLKKIPAKIIHSGIDSMLVTLPFKEKINPVVTEVKIESKLASRSISMNHILPTLEIKGGIVKDSFNVLLNNPQKIEVSWFIYQGNELLSKGSGVSMEYNSAITDRSRTYYIELLYSFGGQENIQTEEYPFTDDILTVSFNIPDRVYPSQSVEALIKVEDQQGRPVSNVDVTAFAVTSKLGYYPPSLPYFGSTSYSRDMGTDFTKEDVNKRTAMLNLEYTKWEKRARLDTMKYYQFTYPYSGMFKHSYAIQDSTQFAPYVMKNGSAQQIYVIEVNREPVYYSWASMPPAYSFYVSPKKKSHVTLRLYDRVLILDSIRFEQGKKTILSIDLDHLPKAIEVVKLYKPAKKRKNRKPPQFTPTEINRHTPLIAGFKPVSQKGYLESKAGFVPLFYSQSRANFVTVGPIAPGRQTFSGLTNGEQLKPLSYQHTGGFNYEFQDNVVYKTDAKDLIPSRLHNSEYDPSATISDLVLTKEKFLENVPAPENKWHARSIDLMDRSMRLSLLLPEEKEKTGIASILLEECKTGKLVSPCTHYSQQSGFYILPRGCHNVIVLYNSGRYFKVEGIDLRSFTKVVVNYNQLEIYPSDKASQGWLQFPPDNCFRSVMPPPRTFQLYSRKAVNGNVQGVVLSAEDNTPLPGVNVIVKGTMNGTATDINGHFSLGISESPSTLVFSFIGLQTKEIEVQAGSVVSVLLEADVTQLQEVVVVGYGVSRERKSLSASSVVLRGMVSGVQIGDVDDEDDTPSAEEKSKQEMKEAEQRLYQELLNLSSIRSNFSDVGFWEPTLFTDKGGETKINVKFPDNITRWDATVYAMNRRLQTGTARKSIKSYKPLMAEFHVPQFLTRGDSVFLLGKVLNYTQDSTINGKIKWQTTGQEKEKGISLTGFHTEKLYTLVASTDTIKGKFIFTRDDGYLDGEEREVPVVDQGIVRADGSLDILKENDVVTIKAAENEKTIIEILDNPMEVLVRDVEDLIRYRYDCNEQLASKLVGLVNYKNVMAFKGKPFRYDKDINRIINRLLKNQNQEFLWSWWDVSSNTSYWMSAHILRALKAAQDAGYTVDLDVKNLAQKASYKFEFQKDVHITDADLLHALAMWNIELNYKVFTKQIDSLIYHHQRVKDIRTGQVRWKSGYFMQKLLMLEIKQLKNIPLEKDSLTHYMKEGILGDVNFTDEKSSHPWYHNELAANTVAYRIVKRDPVLRELTVPMQLYFLKERRKSSWNTYHSSSVIMTVLPDLLQAGARSGQVAKIKLTGKVNEELTKFPYRIELAPEEELRIEKQSGVPLYLMKYKMERVTVAKTGVDGFAIKTSLDTRKSVLQAGQPVNLLVEVNVKRDASMEYVMIEVPIPGSCSYSDKQQSWTETHREYFKEKTVIFCENLKAGTHTFSIPLLPRFTGKFFQNPAQVSLMYVPVVNANTDLKVVKVE
ncbi:MAG TPA: carboxypeptidase-like regulatory domain-containing protein [Cyclobacteriaceae bacterium]